MIDRILKYHNITKDKIDRFLEGNRNNHNDKDRMFFELMFCIAVPQTKAPATRLAVKKLFDSDIIHTGDERQIYEGLSSVRFNEQKAKRIIEARNNFEVIYTKINELKDRPLELREWIVENVKGIGWKESSHFLRNIGLGENLAIFDIHILRTMQTMQLIKSKDGEPITSATGKRYLEYEKIFQNLSKQHNLSPAHMDIAIWLMCSGNNEIM